MFKQGWTNILRHHAHFRGRLSLQGVAWNWILSLLLLSLCSTLLASLQLSEITSSWEQSTHSIKSATFFYLSFSKTVAGSTTQFFGSKVAANQCIVLYETASSLEYIFMYNSGQASLKSSTQLWGHCEHKTKIVAVLILKPLLSFKWVGLLSRGTWSICVKKDCFVLHSGSPNCKHCISCWYFKIFSNCHHFGRFPVTLQLCCHVVFMSQRGAKVISLYTLSLEAL